MNNIIISLKGIQKISDRLLYIRLCMFYKFNIARVESNKYQISGEMYANYIRLIKFGVVSYKN